MGFTREDLLRLRAKYGREYARNFIWISRLSVEEQDEMTRNETPWPL